MRVRKIEWAGLGQMNSCDTDGHRAVYRAADGSLYFGDLTGQNKRLVFKVKPGDVPAWCASRDLCTLFRQFRLSAAQDAGRQYPEHRIPEPALPRSAHGRFGP